MLSAFLKETFRRLSSPQAVHRIPADHRPGTCGDLSQTVEHVVHRTFQRVRALHGYAGRLQGPVIQSLSYIHELVEEIPDARLFRRATFALDPTVNAFFSSPDQIQQLFSGTPEVRQLFDQHEQLGECWALLCMHKEERQQFGMELMGTEVRREVLQTGVTFREHQVLAPGTNEEDARQALKCCVFNSLLGYIQRRGRTLKQGGAELENQHRVLVNRLRLLEANNDASPRQRQVLHEELADLEAQLERRPERLASIRDELNFITRVLEEPSQYVRRETRHLRVSRLGVKLDEGSQEAGAEIRLSEIQVAYHRPRIAVLARFPREELLPERDYLQQASLFLAF